jgi:hypothetical protein
MLLCSGTVCRYHLIPRTVQDGGPFEFRGYMYRFNAGPSVGGFWNFFAKLPAAVSADPSTHSHLSNTETPTVLAALKALETDRIVPRYLPRAMLKAFKDRYRSKIAGLADAGVFEELIAHVLGDVSSGSHGSQSKELRRRVELFLEQDPENVEEIVVDLRKHNGSKEVYTRFYEVLSLFLAAEESKVDARRHQGLSQVPTAWSYLNLRKNVIQFQAERTLIDPVANGPEFTSLETPSP